jgi:putative flippase GtrA
VTEPAAPDWRRRAAAALPLAGRLIRFGLVGGLATAIHAGVALAALRWLGFAPVLAHATGFCVAFVASFCGHSLVTFRTAPSMVRAARFTTVALSTAALSSAIVYALQTWSTLPPEWYLPAVALCIPALNFVLHSLWTFQRERGIVD